MATAYGIVALDLLVNPQGVAAELCDSLLEAHDPIDKNGEILQLAVSLYIALEKAAQHLGWLIWVSDTTPPFPEDW